MTEKYLYTRGFTNDYYLDQNLRRSDTDQRVILAELLRKVLQTSNNHDRAVRQSMNKEDYVIGDNQTWVITQNKTELLEWPKVDQTVTIETKVVDANRFFITRQFLVLAESGEILVKIYLQFTAIDFNTRKMVRLNLDGIKGMDLIEEKTVNFDKLKLSEEATELSRVDYPILPSDIDENQHVNNLVYFRWSYDLIPEKIHQNYRLKMIEMKYGSELRENDSVVIESYRSTGEIFQTDQLIINQTLNKESCYVRMTWEKE